MKTDWMLVIATWVAGLCAAGQFAKIGVTFAEVQALWPEGGASLGLLVSIVGFIGVVFGTSAGLLAARIGARRQILGGLVMAGVLSIVQVAPLSLEVMIVTRVLEGFAHLAVVVVGPVIISQACAPKDQPAGLALWSTFFGLAFTIMALAGLPLVHATGVRMLWLVHGVLSLASALWLSRAMPKVVMAPRAAPDARIGVLRQHVQIYASPHVAAPAIGFLSYTLIYVAMMTLVPGLVPAGWREVLAAGMPLTSITVSLGAGVWLMRRVPAVRVVQWGYLGGVAGALCWGLWPGVGALVGAFVMAGSLGLVQGASFASIAQLNPSAQARAMSAGAVAQLGNVGTTIGTPILLALVHQIGPIALTLYAAPLCLAGALVHAWLAWRRGRDAALAAV